MRVGVMSDLHLEFWPSASSCTWGGPDLGALDGRIDVLVLAGDVHIGVEAARRAKAASERLRAAVAFVAGNHEYYGGVAESVQDEIRRELSGSAARFLDREEMIVAASSRSIRILDCTLWTDFELFGGQAASAAMNAAQSQLNDYREIRLDVDRTPAGTSRILTPEDTLAWHVRDRSWLKDELSKSLMGPRSWSRIWRLGGGRHSPLF